jgi:hypothetical protein
MKRSRLKKNSEKDVFPLGGGLYVEVEAPSEVEKILGFKTGKVRMVKRKG